jgi:hypothetical protein
MSTAARASLEKQLAHLDEQWMAGERDRKMEFLKELWTTNFFDINPGGRFATKEDMLKLFVDTPPKPGSGAFPTDFKLRAVYGDFAVATDHTTIKGFGPIDGEYRCIRMFAKVDGKWKATGSAIVAIVPPAQ